MGIILAKPYASNKAVKDTAHIPRTAHGYEVSWNGKSIIIYDDEDEANRLAEQFGTYAKHSKSRFENPHWKVFSLVGLPSG